MSGNEFAPSVELDQPLGNFVLGCGEARLAGLPTVIAKVGIGA